MARSGGRAYALGAAVLLLKTSAGCGVDEGDLFDTAPEADARPAERPSGAQDEPAGSGVDEATSGPPIVQPSAPDPESPGSPALSTGPMEPEPSGGVPAAEGPVVERGQDAGPEAAGESETSEPPDEAPCEPGPFGAPERVLGLDLALDLWAPMLAADGRTLLFAAGNLQTAENLFSATRESTLELAFFGAGSLPGVNSTSTDGSPFLSRDGLRLYFFSTRPHEGGGGRDLWLASRAGADDPFSDVRPLSELNTPDEEHQPWLTEDELTVVFATTRAGFVSNFDLFLATRASLAEPFGEPAPLLNVNSDALEGRGALSGDGLMLVLMSARGGGQGREDLWVSQRATQAVAFGTPINLQVANSAAAELDPALSADGRELFFSSDRAGRQELWRSTRAACTP